MEPVSGHFPLSAVSIRDISHHTTFLRRGDILRFGGIVSHDAELPTGDARNDEVRLVPSAPGPGEHLHKADVLPGVQF